MARRSLARISRLMGVPVPVMEFRFIPGDVLACVDAQGVITVNPGSLSESPWIIQGVLAHEMGHLTGGHAVLRTRLWYAFALATVLLPLPVSGLICLVVLSLITTACVVYWTEKDADLRASVVAPASTRILTAAHGSSSSFASVMEAMFFTHPLFGGALRAVRQAIREFRLRRRAPSRRRRPPS